MTTCKPALSARISHGSRVAWGISTAGAQETVPNKGSATRQSGARQRGIAEKTLEVHDAHRVSPARHAKGHAVQTLARVAACAVAIGSAVPAPAPETPDRIVPALMSCGPCSFFLGTVKESERGTIVFVAETEKHKYYSTLNQRLRLETITNTSTKNKDINEKKRLREKKRASPHSRALPHRFEGRRRIEGV